VEVPDTDATSDLVQIEGGPDGGASGDVTVWISRPAKKNAFDSTTIAALHQAFETIHGQDHVRIVFLRGRGGNFSAGADLDWMRSAFDLTEAENHADAMALARMLKQLYELRPLTVAVVEGGSFGGGVGLVAAADAAIATKDARFGFTEVKLGILAATISPYVIRAIGPKLAKILFATGRLFDAAYAEKIGLVQEVVADAEALEAAQKRWLADVKVCAPGAVSEAKRLVDDVVDRPIDHHLMDETARRIAAARVSAEGREGIRAFLDKRKPNWIG
ncbi:MAG TPA: enoyl-CoA hydratase-related protein, partial [Caulobacteraceae bacterium]|nr:enoyl-CoA hydratase-related protein [Caulobacteraceae bacterium]